MTDIPDQKLLDAALDHHRNFNVGRSHFVSGALWERERQRKETCDRVQKTVNEAYKSGALHCLEDQAIGYAIGLITKYLEALAEKLGKPPRDEIRTAINTVMHYCKKQYSAERFEEIIVDKLTDAVMSMLA